MLALQSQLHRSSLNLVKRPPWMIFVNKLCKKGSVRISATENEDVSEKHRRRKKQMSNKTADKRLRDQEISLLGREDPRFPFPGSIGPFSWSSFAIASFASVENDDKFISQTHSQPLLSDYFSYELFDASAFEFEIKECPRLLYEDVQLLFSFDFNSKPTLVMLHRKKDDKMDKEELIRQFVHISRVICKKLENFKFEAHFVNPFDVTAVSDAESYEVMQRFRDCSFKVKSKNNCKVITRRSWGKDSFVGLLFTDASRDSEELRAILRELSL